MLIGAGILERTARAGERRIYYRLRSGTWDGVFEARLRLMVQIKEVAECALAAAGGEADSRLMDVRDVFAWTVHELEEQLKRRRARAARGASEMRYDSITGAITATISSLSARARAGRARRGGAIAIPTSWAATSDALSRASGRSDRAVIGADHLLGEEFSEHGGRLLVGDGGAYEAQNGVAALVGVDEIEIDPDETLDGLAAGQRRQAGEELRGDASPIVAAKSPSFVAK